ncbi:E3 ubiquitin ISG15 ligase TRIM25-like [Pelobates cultripes]|uniref:E3 ubiquitin ISG15 ligase TRIM25-like n=1 Tax=Pelobates cultripes TaxID=61616 RepID=A0AAD1SJD1_PELCU|nr:E3 ubiquitin ISG15 ligase TRIM25-like [Pelobates cultripes]
MASADLRDELTCSVCLNIYTEPVTLPCGHSFCRVCIENVLDTREVRGYSCPECRFILRKKPELKRNHRLCNIVKSFRFTKQTGIKIGIPCSYCIHSPVPAAKTCLHCEASLCEAHLKVHSQSAEHILTEPTTSLENRKCSVHKEILKYYCSDDATCVCVSCRLDGDHRGHQVQTLNEASEKKKEKLRNILQKLTSKREEAEKRVHNLQELKREVQKKAAGVTEEVTALIRGIKKQLEAVEKRVLSEISRHEMQVSLQVSDLIRQLEIKKKDLSRKMGHIEELCNMTDPLTVLQGRKSDRVDYCDTEEGDNEHRERDDKKVCAVGDLDLGLISVTLHSGLAGIVTGVKRQSQVPANILQGVNTSSNMLLDVNTASDMLLGINTVSDMLLDVNTAANNVTVSGDMKTVSLSEVIQSRPETPERFQSDHVLSARSFSSGRHYWELESSESGGWTLGMAYRSIDREGWQSQPGYNSKYWGLERSWLIDDYNVRYDSKGTFRLCHRLSSRRLGIFLDYEAGRLSFYELCDPIRHLHTFTATFTEPLHALFGVYENNTWLRI